MKTASLRTLLGLALLFVRVSQSMATDPVSATISGRVIAPGGAGVSGISAVLFDFYQHQYTNITHPDGGFTFTVPAGSWNFYIPDGQTQGLITPTFSFLITQSTNIINVQAQLLAQDATIIGSLKDPNGQPVEGVRIYAYRFDDIREIGYNLPYVLSDAGGNFTIAANKATWYVNPECGDLLSHSFDCVGMNVDASSGSATANFLLTTGPQPTIEAPRMEITPVGDTGFIQAVLIFTLRGAPGGYDIQARNDVPLYNYSWPDVDYATIPIGGDSAEVRIYLNTYPSMPNAQFFKAHRRVAAQ